MPSAAYGAVRLFEPFVRERQHRVGFDHQLGVAGGQALCRKPLRDKLVLEALAAIAEQELVAVVAAGQLATLERS